MMLCASACFEATGPLSAVAAEVTPKATTTTQTNAGMWLILRLMPDSPSGDKTPLLCSLRERHKGRRVTAFPDVCKVKNKPKMTQTRLSPGRTNCLDFGASVVGFRPLAAGQAPPTLARDPCLRVRCRRNRHGRRR